MGGAFGIRLRRGALAVALLWLGWPGHADVPAPGAAALRARESALADRLAHNAFGAPLVIESDAQGASIGGDVFARIAQPYTRIAETLTLRANWCEVLILHLNVKRCEPTAQGLALDLGRKYEQPLESTQRLAFDAFAVSASPDYLRVVMTAPDGPLQTRDYRIEFEATPSSGTQSFVHLRYAFSAGLAGRVIMQTYLMTLGRSKVGFSSSTGPDDDADLVGGARGVVERNAMRYYLAVVAYLQSLELPAERRLEQRLATWFDASERYPRQLHELGRDAYLTMKRNELRRQSAGP